MLKSQQFSLGREQALQCRSITIIVDNAVVVGTLDVANYDVAIKTIIINANTAIIDSAAVIDSTQNDAQACKLNNHVAPLKPNRICPFLLQQQQPRLIHFNALS